MKAYKSIQKLCICVDKYYQQLNTCQKLPQIMIPCQGQFQFMDCDNSKAFNLYKAHHEQTIWGIWHILNNTPEKGISIGFTTFDPHYLSVDCDSSIYLKSTADYNDLSDRPLVLSLGKATPSSTLLYNMVADVLQHILALFSRFEK